MYLHTGICRMCTSTMCILYRCIGVSSRSSRLRPCHPVTLRFVPISLSSVQRYKSQKSINHRPSTIDYQPSAINRKHSNIPLRITYLCPYFPISLFSFISVFLPISGIGGLLLRYRLVVSDPHAIQNLSLGRIFTASVIQISGLT